MAKARTTLADEVLANLPRKGPARWYEQLDQVLLQELDELRADFLASRLGPSVTKTGLAKAISKSMQGRGIKVGLQGVLLWLEGR